MDYNVKTPPLLQRLMLAKIVVLLWNTDDIKVLSEHHKSFDGADPESWLEIADKVIEKAESLPLPLIVKNKVKGVIYSIGFQLYDWVTFHAYYCGFDKKLPEELYWTPEGKIDRKRTAEMLAMDESFDMSKRYKVACTHCLERCAASLWRRMRHGELHGKNLKKIRIYEKPLVAFWSHCIEDELEELGNEIRKWSTRAVGLYEYEFERAADSGNEVATNYFLQKLEPENKERTVVQTAKLLSTKCTCVPREKIPAPRDIRADVFCFLLTTMTIEQQEEVFQSHPSYVLDCFLDWPWQDYFVPTAQRMWDFLPVRHYGVLLLKIAKAGTLDYADYNYQELFERFWMESPVSCKQHVIDMCTRSGDLFSKLLKAEDKKNIILVLKPATAEEKEKFILHKGRYIYESLIQENKWHLLMFFVEQCISTKSAMSDFKSEFTQYILHKYSVEMMNETEVKTFVQFLDDFISGNGQGMEVDPGDK